MRAESHWLAAPREIMRVMAAVLNLKASPACRAILAASARLYIIAPPAIPTCVNGCV